MPSRFGSPAAHRAVAHRPRFRRPRSRGSHLPQRRALLRRLRRHGASGDLRRMAGCHRAAPRTRPCASVPVSRFTATLLYVRPAAALWPPRGIVEGPLERRALRPAVALSNRCSPASPSSEDAWTVDGESECLMPSSRSAGFHFVPRVVRSSAAVDRAGDSVDAALHRVPRIHPRQRPLVCRRILPMTPRWTQRVKAAIRLLADSGFGGERSRGWGRSRRPSSATTQRF